MAGKETKPLVTLRADYDASLKETLEAAEMLVAQVEVMLKLDLIPSAGRGELEKSVARYRRAVYGD